MKIKKQKQTGVGSNKDSPFNNIDGDLIAYSVASASDGKYYTIHGIAGKYKYIADVKEAFKKEGKPYNRSLVTEAYDPDPIENALHSVKLVVESWIEGAGNGEYLVLLSGKDNYRRKIGTIQPYKGNRFTGKQREFLRAKGEFLDWLDKTEAKFVEPRKPAHLTECRDYLIRRWGAVVKDGEEADDALGYLQTDDTILTSVDKDLDCIAGKHYRPPWKGAEGYLYTVSQVEADRNFYKQLLMGDTTDNIGGLKGVGAKSPFMKVIDTLTDPREMAEFCFEKYFDYELVSNCDKPLHVLKNMAYEKFLENGRLVWIRREEGQIWEPPKKTKEEK